MCALESGILGKGNEIKGKEQGVEDYKQKLKGKKALRFFFTYYTYTFILILVGDHDHLSDGSWGSRNFM